MTPRPQTPAPSGTHGTIAPHGAPGDFLALLPRPPILHPAASTVPHALEATTVFAFRCAAGVLVGGDHRATAGNAIFSDRADKVLTLDAHTILAIAGSPAVAFEIARTLQTSFEFYRRSQLQALSLDARLRAVSRLLRENLQATLAGIGAVAPLIAGADPGRDPQIFFYDPLGAQFEGATHAASGSGAPAIRAILAFLDSSGQPPASLQLPPAIVLANRLLQVAASLDAATGGIDPSAGRFATLRLLGPAGVRDIPPDEQSSAWSTTSPSG